MSERFGRNFEMLWGSGQIERLFPDEKPTTIAPWPSATRRKNALPYEPDKVQAAIAEGRLQKVDPRTVRATQPEITRQGVAHYLGSNEIFRDAHQAGNQHPVVYRRDDGVTLLLSGHHRAARSLLRGEDMDAIVAEGSWGERPTPRQSA